MTRIRSCGNWAELDPLGWSIDGGFGGLFAPTPAVIANSSDNVVFLDGGATLARDTGVILATGEVYQLTFKVGHRLDQDFGGGTARLMTADGEVLASITLPTPQAGRWVPVTLKTLAIPAANNGEELRIEISDGAASGNQILIDDIELNEVVPNTYDDELLDAHYMAGDGRANENIALTAVHHVFHAEHNRLVATH